MIRRTHDELSPYFLPYQAKRNVWIHESTQFMGNIYRYTSFTNLIDMLNGKFYLSPRLAFSDRREQGEYTSEYIKVGYKNTIDRNRMKFREKVKEKFKLSTYFNVSCWTMEEHESFPMWKAYKGDDISVRIKTSIHSLLSSIRDTDIHLYCGAMHYGEEEDRTKMYDIMFKKTIEYEDEKEFRLYAIREQYDFDKEPSHLILNINPTEMIDEIYFSPFIGRNKATDLCDLLLAKYPFLKGKFNFSDLIEY